MKRLLFVLSAVLMILLLLLKINTRQYSFQHSLPVRHTESRNSAIDALQFTTMAADYPNKTLPPDAYTKAINWYANNSERKSGGRISSPSTSWHSMGPFDIGGRTIGFAIDPVDTGTIWLGAASGGLWKSTSGGIGNRAWTYVPLGFPVLGVSSIAINQQNHNIMYVGTGEVYSDSSYSQGIVNIRCTRGSYGMGLFKSTNGGASWTQSINWTYQQNLGIWDIIINSLDTSEVYVAATNGVYKSNNAGKTWTQVLQIPMVMNMVMHKTDTNILLCGVGDYGSTLHGIYRTSNSGATWSAVTNGLPSPTYNGRVTVATYNNNNDTMFAHICDIYNTVGVYLSTDKGLTWALQKDTNLASDQGWYCKGVLAQPGNPRMMLIGSVDLFQSGTMGKSFHQVDNLNNSQSAYMHTDVHGLYVNPLNSKMVYILTDGGLFRSNDFGDTYYECVGGYCTTQHYIGSISSTDTTQLLSGLQDNFTIKYWDTGYWYAVIGGDGSYNAIDHTNASNQYGSYQYLNVYNSYDSGYNNSWTQIIYNTDNGFIDTNYGAFLAPFILCNSNTSYIYAGGRALQVSTDGGYSWNTVGNNPVNSGAWIMCIAASFTNTDSIYFCTAPDSIYPFKMFSSVDGGNTTHDITSGLPDRYPRRIAVNPSNSQEVYIVFSGFGTGHIFKSLNGGGAWKDISTALPDMPFEVITVDPAHPQTLFAGCDFGVFYSTDDGNTWTTYDNGFPDITMVFDLLVSPSDHYLYAFTHGRGIFKRDLSDITYSGFPATEANSIHANIYPNPAIDILNVKMSNFNSNSSYYLTLYDLQGKETYSAYLQSSVSVVPVNKLAAGMYLLNISNGNSILFSEKFIKE